MVNLYTASTFNECKKRLLEILKTADTKDLEKSHIILVPDRYTLNLEEQTLGVLENMGALNIEVLTFSRLVLKLKEIDAAKYIQLSDAVMIIKRLCLKHSSEFKTFAKSANLSTFAENMLMLINQFKSSNITADDLKKNLNKLGASFSRKLQDIAFLYEKYTKFLGSDYFDSSDVLRELPAIIKNSDFIKKCNFYAIGYDSLTKLAQNAIFSISKYANNLNLFAIRTQRDDFQKINFVYEKYLRLSNNNETALPDCIDKTAQVLKANLFAKNIYATAENENIKIYECTGIYDEARLCAADINYEVLKNNLRYKDVGVVFTDEKLGRILSAVFLEYGIPSYIESKRTLNLHPLSKLLLDILNVVRLNFDRESFVEVLKNPLIKIDFSKKDNFENYILKYGLDRKKLLNPLEDFTINSNAYKEAEIVRALVLKTINLMKLDNFGTALEYCKNIRNFIKIFEAEKKLEAFNDELSQKNYLEYLGYSKQVLLNIEEILSSIEYIFKDTAFKIDEFYKILLSGFSAKELLLIPKVADCVTCGDYKSVVFSNFKKLYVLGCVKNAYPTITENTGIIKDEDIDLLKNAGLDLEPKTEDINEREKYFIYSMFLENCKELNLSYSGDAAECLTDINLSLKLSDKPFSNKGNCEETTIKEFYTKNRIIKNALTKVLKIRNGDNDDGTAYAVFNAAIDRNLKAKLNDAYLKLKGGEILKEKTEKIFFENGTSSVTAIETYYNCPYKHFLRYGLGAKERDVAQFRPVDVGRFLHLAAELFVKRKDFNCDITKVSEDIFNKIIEDDEYKKYLNDPYSKNILFKLKDELNRLLTAISIQFKNSDFKPLYTEFKFGKNDFPIELIGKKIKVNIKGVIDRIDIFDFNGAQYIRVIDYKSGKSEYSEKDLYYGKKIQLFIYLYALTKDEKYKAAGAYYFPIHNKFTKEDRADGVYCMEGPTLDNQDIIYACDKNLKDGNSSRIVKIKMDGEKLSKSSKVLTSEEFNLLCSYAKLLCDNFVQGIEDGNIEILPLESVCNYCEYISVCKNYDRKNQRKTKSVDLNKIKEAVLCKKI